MMCKGIFVCALTIKRKTMLYIYTSTDIQLNTMRKIFTLVCILSCLGASAQKLSIGLKGGTAHSNLIKRPNTMENVDMLNGYQTSLTVEYNFCPGFYVGTGAMYNQRGYTNIRQRFTDGTAGGSLVYIYQGDYMFESISLPLYAGIKTNKQLYGYFNGGMLFSRILFMNLDNIRANHPYMDFLPSGSYKVTSTNIDMALMTEAGAGYKFSEKFGATLSASYVRDISNHRTSNMHSLFAQLGIRYTF